VGGVPRRNADPDRANERLIGEPVMRITEGERTEIARAITRQDPDAVVYVFGPRADDNA
jgi:hypothetical protein